MVNRLWQHHFGAGIVATPSDFGLQGERPSHPELLDWLAVEFAAPTTAPPFLRCGSWNVKALQRLIVTSATYRQSSNASPASTASTPPTCPRGGPVGLGDDVVWLSAGLC